jgi:type II secretory pathway component PulF
MKEKSSTLSLTSLTAGVMSIITVFGGYTVFLGLAFAFIGILTGIRGRRYNPTKLAKHAVRISIFGFALCILVILIFTTLYLSSLLDFSFDFYTLYEFVVDIIDRLIH